MVKKITPLTCQICGVRISAPHRRYCEECRRIGIKTCKVCGKKFTGNLGSGICINCTNNPKKLEKWKQMKAKNYTKGRKKAWKEHYDTMASAVTEVLVKTRIEHRDAYLAAVSRNLSEYHKKMKPIREAQRAIREAQKEVERNERKERILANREHQLQKKRAYNKEWKLQRRLNREIKICEHCGRRHRNPGRYCSKSCSNSARECSDYTRAKRRILKRNWWRNQFSRKNDYLERSRKRSVQLRPKYIPTPEDYEVRIPIIHDRHDFEDIFGDEWSVGGDW